MEMLTTDGNNAKKKFSKATTAKFTTDIETWTALTEKEKVSSSESDKFIIETTMASLRELSKEIVETDWMFDEN